MIRYKLYITSDLGKFDLEFRSASNTKDENCLKDAFNAFSKVFNNEFMGHITDIKIRKLREQ